MITVSKELLQRALKVVGKTIPSRATLPVLTHVCLSAYGGLELKGSDLEQTTVVEVDVKGDDLDICVPFSVFTKYVDNLENAPIDIEQDGTKVVLTQGEIKAEFHGIPGVEFPIIPTVDKNNVLTLDAEQAKYVLSSVLHAVATDEGRPVLTGILVRQANNEIVFATADGFRLAVTVLEYNTVEDPFAVIVPSKAAVIALGALPDSGYVYLYFDNTRVSFCLPEDNGLKTTVYSQVVEGTFPNYQQIIPNKATPFKVENDTLTKAIKRASVLAGQSANNITYTLSQGRLVMESNAVEYGEGKETIDVEWGGEEVTFALNYSYTLDALATLGDVVEVEVTASHRPLVFSSNRDEHLCVLMPMHVR